MAAATCVLELVSVAHYLSSDFEPDAEYVDGVIEERPMGQFDHASWQKALLLWFSAQAKEWNVRVLPEYRVKVAATRYRVPDVTVFHRELPIEQVLTHAPVAVFEVLSPEDQVSRVLRKLADYQAMGIRTIVVINPETDIVYRYYDGVLTPSEEPTCPGSACTLDWSKIRELRD